MSGPLKIAVVGDYNPEFRSHPATTAALERSGASLQMAVQAEWVPTESVPTRHPEATLGTYDGIVASPGSPYRSFHGALAAICYARERKRPFFGT